MLDIFPQSEKIRLGDVRAVRFRAAAASRLRLRRDRPCILSDHSYVDHTIMRLGSDHRSRFQKRQRAKVALGFLQSLRAVNVAFMTEEKFFDDRAMRLDVQPVGESINAASLCLARGVDIERLDGDRSDS